MNSEAPALLISQLILRTLDDAINITPDSQQMIQFIRSDNIDIKSKKQFMDTFVSYYIYSLSSDKKPDHRNPNDPSLRINMLNALKDNPIQRQFNIEFNKITGLNRDTYCSVDNFVSKINNEIIH